MKNKRLFLVCALICLAGCLAALGFRRSSSVHAEPMPERALGEAAAEAAGELLDNRGQVLVIAEAAADAVQNGPAAAFESALRSKGAVSVAAVERLKPMDRWLRAKTPGGSSCSAGDFLMALQKHGQADAVVSFVGFPIGESAELTALRQRGCKMIAVFNSSASSELNRAIGNHLVDLAIVLRQDVAPSTDGAAKTARDYFSRHYMIVKPN
jgi:hypothetical protein